jgi:metallothiol transferase
MRGDVDSERRAMKLTPLIYVTDMDRSIDFYTRLVPAATVVSSSAYWTELVVGGATLALHFSQSVDHEGDGMGLSIDVSISLEELIVRLESAGIGPIGEICDEPFGRSVTVEDPDGLMIQINEHSEA